jgi:hypothetical protein
MSILGDIETMSHPLKMSPNNVRSAGLNPTVLQTFVIPIFFEPCSLISISYPRNAMMSPNGMDPIMYEQIKNRKNTSDPHLTSY